MFAYFHCLLLVLLSALSPSSINSLGHLEHKFYTLFSEECKLELVDLVSLRRDVMNRLIIISRDFGILETNALDPS